MPEPDFGRFIKELRERCEFSQRQLAYLSGVSNTEIKRIEDGTRKRPSQEILKKLAKPLGVEYERLLQAAGYYINPQNSDILPNNEDTNISSTHRRIESALADDPDAEELLSFWKELKEREDLFLLFKQVRPLSDDSIRRVIRVIKAIEAEEEDEANR